jgi:hypothetical protein
VETVLALATTHPGPVFSEWQRADRAFSLGHRPLSGQDLTRAAEALSGLPRGEWAVGQYQFLVQD